MAEGVSGGTVVCARMSEQPRAETEGRQSCVVGRAGRLGVQPLALPLTHWVTSGKFLPLCVPQFPHLDNGSNNEILSVILKLMSVNTVIKDATDLKHITSHAPASSLFLS